MEKSSTIIQNVLCHHQYVNLLSIFYEIFITAGFYNKKKNKNKNKKHLTLLKKINTIQVHHYLSMYVGKEEFLFMLKGVFLF